MKEYHVKFDTVIEGRHAKAGSTVKLADDKAKIYKGAGLIETVEERDDRAKKDAAKADPKAGANTKPAS